MNKFKLFFVLSLSMLFFVACGTKEKPESEYTKEEMQQFEKELEEEIQARKIDIMQMKQDIEQLEESKKKEIEQDIEKIENRFTEVESDVDKLKTMRDSGWADFKSQVDSTLNYIELRIDTTRVNIEQALITE